MGSDFLTVFAARTTGPFFSRLPSYHLGIAALVAMGASTGLSHYWDDILDLPEMKSLTWKWIGFVWAYCLVWFFLQDIIKALTYWALYKMNIGSEAHHQGLMQKKDKVVAKRDNRRALTHESVMKGESLAKASVRMTGKSTAAAGSGRLRKVQVHVLLGDHVRAQQPRGQGQGAEGRPQVVPLLVDLPFFVETELHPILLKKKKKKKKKKK